MGTAFRGLGGVSLAALCLAAFARQALVRPPSPADSANTGYKTAGGTFKPPPAGVTRSAADFGAVGDGVADDTAALQRAIDAVARAGGGTVRLPKGTYKVSINPAARREPAVAVRAGVALKGSGADRSVIKLADRQGNYDAILGASPDSADLSDFALYDLGIDGNGGNNPVAGEADLQKAGLLRHSLRVYAGSNIAVERCRFVNSAGVQTVTLNGAVSNVVVRRNTFDRTGGGKADYDHSTVYTHAHHVTIADNTFASRNGPGNNGARTAIEIHGSEQVVRGNTIIGYFCGVNVTGIADASNNQLYEKNKLREVAQGFQVWSGYYGKRTSGPGLTNVVIRDNDVVIDVAGWRGFFDDSDRSGVTFDPNRRAPVDNFDVVGNRFAYQSFTGAKTGADHFSGGVNVWKYRHASVPVGNLRILKNRIENSPGAGIYLGAVLNGGDVADNTVLNPGRTENAIDAAFRSGIYLENKVRGLRVRDNTVIDDQEARTLHFGVVERTTSLGDNRASGNSVRVASGARVPVWSPSPVQLGLRWVVD